MKKKRTFRNGVCQEFWIQTGGGYTTFIFTLPKPQRGIPSEKIVRLKNDA